MARDPVCGMQVGERAARNRSPHMGKTYYFCSVWCKEAFDKNSGLFIGPTSPETAAAQGATLCQKVPFFG